MCIRHQFIVSGDTTIHVKGREWQSYLVFCQSGSLSLVDSSAASSEPVVTKVTGATITAKKIDGNGFIDLNVHASSVRVMVISYASFTMTAE